MGRTDTGLFNACRHLAQQVLAQSAGSSNDVIETLAERFLRIAEDHQDFVRRSRETDTVIEHAVRYLAEVHAIPPMGTDTQWFSASLNVLMQLAVPNSRVGQEGAQLFPCIQEGMRESLATVPVPRSELRIEDEDAETVKLLEAAGCAHGAASELLDLVERLYHGDPLSVEHKRFMWLAATAAPLTRKARGDS